MLALLALVVAGQAGALHFEWTAPPSCPTAAALRARLGNVAGVASATVREEAGGWVLEVRARDSTRTLVAKTCEEAADAAVLIIQLALTPSPRALPEPPLVSPVPVEAAPTWSLHAAVAGGASLAWFPSPLVRLGVTLSARRGPLAFGVDLTTALEQRYAGGPTAEAAVAVRAVFDGQLHGCWYFDAERFSAGPCVQAALSSLEVRGLNVSSPRASSTLLWSAGPGARASFRLTGWLEVLAATALRFGPRPSVFFEGAAPVLEAGPVAVDLWAGVGGFW